MTKFAIDRLRAREILDSRGNPTVEVQLSVGGNDFKAKVPSGASTGTHEALELRDKDPSRFHGKGVLKAVSNVNGPIRQALVGKAFPSIIELDKALINLDGTKNKGKLGANAILGVSMASARAFAHLEEKPLFEYLGNGQNLPVPYLNIINGSSHAGNDLAIQEFMIAPGGMKTFKEAMRAGAEVYHVLKKKIREKYGKGGANVGDEGGFAPPASESREALDLIMSAIEETGYQPGTQVHIGIDAAAAVFFKDGNYHIDGKVLSEGELVDYYLELVVEYPLKSIEDPFDEEAYGGFAELTKKVRDNAQVVGDDLLVTNPKRIQKGIEMKSCTGLLLKPNQIGTVTEATEACRMAQNAGWNVMVSHRSGETTDEFIADLVVGLDAGQIKSGAPARSERVCKYNRLMEIEEEHSGKVRY